MIKFWIARDDFFCFVLVKSMNYHGVMFPIFFWEDNYEPTARTSIGHVTAVVLPGGLVHWLNNHTSTHCSPKLSGPRPSAGSYQLMDWKKTTLLPLLYKVKTCVQWGRGSRLHHYFSKEVGLSSVNACVNNSQLQFSGLPSTSEFGQHCHTGFFNFKDSLQIKICYFSLCVAFCFQDMFTIMFLVKSYWKSV